MKRRAAILLPFLGTAAWAHSYKANGIAIGHAWALPASQGVDGQAFMPILNVAETRDALIFARSDICSLIELRRNVRYDDPAESVFELLPDEPLPMRPGARHLRLLGLGHHLAAGQTFLVVLDFRNAGEIEVEAIVESKGGH